MERRDVRMDRIVGRGPDGPGPAVPDRLSGTEFSLLLASLGTLVTTLGAFVFL